MKHMKKLIALALAVMSIMAIAIPALAYMYVYVDVPIGETVNVRDWPNGNIVFTLPRGTMVDMQAWADPTWSKVTVPGRTGDYYIMSEFLSPTQPAPAWQVRYGTATLRYAPNVVNSYVKNLQRDLYSAGYTSVTQADGRYGTITKTAVENFQRNNSLTVDGIAGNQTKQALWNKLHP